MKTRIEFSIPLKQFEFSKLPWKTFVLTFLGMFIMVSLQYLGVHLPKISLPFNTIHLLDPLSAKSSTFDKIAPKLEQKPNTYQIKKQSGFIASSYAADANNYDAVTAYALLDYDTGEIISDKNGDSSVPIASLTKVMSSVVALDLMSPNEEITVQSDATTVTPTRIGVKTGEKLTVEELLDSMLMTSANDAAQVIKDGIDKKYGDEVFVRAMNDKAKFLGLTHTHFANPQGFDDNKNYSSADDLAILTHYALANYPLISQIVAQDKASLEKNTNHHVFALLNWNGLLGVYPNVFGVKIGNTDAAQTTMIVGAQRGGKKILVVELGAPGILERDMWAAQLLDLGFSQTMQLPPVNVTEAQLHVKYQSWYN